MQIYFNMYFIIVMQRYIFSIKCIQYSVSFTFFSIVQSNEWKGRPSVRKSGDCNDGGETCGVCRGLPGAVLFKVSATMTVYLTAKPKDFRALAL